MPVTPCLGTGLGACPVLSPAVLCWVGWGGVGGRVRAGWVGSRTPRAWWRAPSLPSCERAILLLLVTSLTKLVFGFWDS